MGMLDLMVIEFIFRFKILRFKYIFKYFSQNIRNIGVNDRDEKFKVNCQWRGEKRGKSYNYVRIIEFRVYVVSDGC